MAVPGGVVPLVPVVLQFHMSTEETLATYAAFYNGNYTKGQLEEHLSKYLNDNFVLHVDVNTNTLAGKTQLAKDEWVAYQSSLFDKIGPVASSESKFALLPNADVLWSFIPILSDGAVQSKSYMLGTVVDGKLSLSYLISEESYDALTSK